MGASCTPQLHLSYSLAEYARQTSRYIPTRKNTLTTKNDTVKTGAYGAAGCKFAVTASGVFHQNHSETARTTTINKPAIKRTHTDGTNAIATKNQASGRV